MTTAQSNRINAQIAKVTKEINLRNPKLEMEIKSMLKGYQERRIRSIATVRKALKAAVKQDVPVMAFNSAKIDALGKLHRAQNI